MIADCVVGLDVQQKYRVYYSGVKRFGAESCIRENPTWRVQRIYTTEKTQDTTLTAPAPSNRGQTPWQHDHNMIRFRQKYNTFKLDLKHPSWVIKLQVGRWDTLTITYVCYIHLKDIFWFSPKININTRCSDKSAEME